MFCPNCGRDNAQELKFCASCGINLEAVSRALTGNEEDVVTRLDAGIDQFISRYTEHIFPEKRPASVDNTVARSWKLLGQAVVTSLIDVLLFSLMWNILPIRFVLLVITSPFRLLSEKSRKQRERELALEEYAPPVLPEGNPDYVPAQVPSVIEETTRHLKARAGRGRDTTPDTDKLE